MHAYLKIHSDVNLGWTDSENIRIWILFLNEILKHTKNQSRSITPENYVTETVEPTIWLTWFAIFKAAIEVFKHASPEFRFNYELQTLLAKFLLDGISTLIRFITNLFIKYYQKLKYPPVQSFTLRNAHACMLIYWVLESWTLDVHNMYQLRMKDNTSELWCMFSYSLHRWTDDSYFDDSSPSHNLVWSSKHSFPKIDLMELNIHLRRIWFVTHSCKQVYKFTMYSLVLWMASE